nr:hypothetical protein [Tanacetum cinerariifolium]
VNVILETNENGRGLFTCTSILVLGEQGSTSGTLSGTSVMTECAHVKDEDDSMVLAEEGKAKAITFDEIDKAFCRIAMSSDNAQSAVTYTSISSNSDGPSWGIPLMNAGELPEMDPYKEVAQQGQAHPLSPAYVPDPMELDEHTPVYVPEPQHSEYHAPSADDIQVEDDDDDPEEDHSEEHELEDDDEDPEEDPNEEHESKGSDETEPFKEDKIVVTPPPSRHHGARISRDEILEEDMPPRRRFALTGSPPGCDVAESSAAAVARAPRSQYDFVDTVEAGQGLIRSPGHDTQTIARAADRAEDASYVRVLQASERRMMTSIKKVNLRVSYQAQVCRQESENFYTQLLDVQTDRRDIRLEIDVVRGQRTAYETELQEVHQAYLSSEARNRELLARLEMLETHMSRMEWQRQSVGDLVVTQMMRIHTLEARARTDTVEDADNSWTEGVVGLSQWLEKMESIFHISSCVIDNQVKFATCTLLGVALTWWNGHANDLMDQKLRTYAERQNESKRKANDSPRNNQQQPHKKQNVARAYTAGPGEKKVYTGDLPMCTKCNYHHTSGNGVAQGRVYALGGREASPDSNVITGNRDNQREES